VIYPLAIATDGYLDQRQLLGIATRGYIWAERVGAELPHPEIQTSVPGWAEEPTVFAGFQDDRRVGASLLQSVTTAHQENILVSAVWVDNGFVIADFEEDKKVSVETVEVGFVFVEKD
jgi:hypothetical protein